VEQATENYRITKINMRMLWPPQICLMQMWQHYKQLNLSTAAADAVVAYNKLLLTAGILNNN
jgi:hypothetical protein